MVESGLRHDRGSGKAIVAEHLCKVFNVTRGIMHRTKSQVVAVKDVSFEVDYGELFGVVGLQMRRPGHTAVLKRQILESKHILIHLSDQKHVRNVSIHTFSLRLKIAEKLSDVWLKSFSKGMFLS